MGDPWGPCLGRVKCLPNLAEDDCANSLLRDAESFGESRQAKLVVLMVATSRVVPVVGPNPLHIHCRQLGASVFFPCRMVHPTLSLCVHGVVALSAEEQVSRIHAKRNVAGVANVEPFGDRSVSEFPSDSVGILDFAAMGDAKSYMAIAES